MVRILHVLGGLNRGGAETMVMNIYRSIDHNKFQFDFIIHNNTEKDYQDEIEMLGGRIYVFPAFKGYNFIMYRNKWDRFLDEHPEYSIVHSHVRSYASIFFPIVKRHGLKNIIHSHSTSNGFGIKSLIKKILQKPLVKQADYLFACSNVSGEWLFGKRAVKKNNYFLVKNSIDVNKYRFNTGIRNKYREELCIENKVVFGHVGRLTEPKNHIYLLKVFKEILERSPDSVLVIVGDGELKNKIIDEIKKLKLQDYVYMLGTRNDIANILQCIDVFLFPSLWEGLPITVLEAQAAGLPCIISDTITDEVKLLSNIVCLPIKNSVDLWATSALNEVDKRYPQGADAVIEGGFDVGETAKWLMDFYRGLIYE